MPKRVKPCAVERVLDRSEPDLNTGCVLWSGAVRGDGYGNIKINKRAFMAHRVVFFGGDRQDPSVVVMHKCDTPLCVNRQHLQAGTHADNAADRTRKGRSRNDAMTAGEKLAARRLRAVGASCADIAQRLDRNPSTVMKWLPA